MDKPGPIPADETTAIINIVTKMSGPDLDQTHRIVVLNELQDTSIWVSSPSATERRWRFCAQRYSLSLPFSTPSSPSSTGPQQVIRDALTEKQQVEAALFEPEPPSSSFPAPEPPLSSFPAFEVLLFLGSTGPTMSWHVEHGDEEPAWLSIRESHSTMITCIGP